MTYEDIFEEFLKEFPNMLAVDYRPAIGLYIDGVDACSQIPNAIIVWLKNGSKIIYIAKQ